MKDGVRAAVWEGGEMKEVGAREGKLRTKLLKAKKSPNFSLSLKKRLDWRPVLPIYIICAGLRMSTSVTKKIKAG